LPLPSRARIYLSGPPRRAGERGKGSVRPPMSRAPGFRPRHPSSRRARHRAGAQRTSPRGRRP